MEDLDTMYQLLINMVERSANIFEHEDFSRYDSLIKDEDYLDMIEAKYKEKHYRGWQKEFVIQRLRLLYLLIY